MGESTRSHGKILDAHNDRTHRRSRSVSGRLRIEHVVGAGRAVELHVGHLWPLRVHKNGHAVQWTHVASNVFTCHQDLSQTVVGKTAGGGRVIETSDIGRRPLRIVKGLVTIQRTGHRQREFARRANRQICDAVRVQPNDRVRFGCRPRETRTHVRCGVVRQGRLVTGHSRVAAVTGQTSQHHARSNRIQRDLQRIREDSTPLNRWRRRVADPDSCCQEVVVTLLKVSGRGREFPTAVPVNSCTTDECRFAQQQAVVVHIDVKIGVRNKVQVQVLFQPVVIQVNVQHRSRHIRDLIGVAAARIRRRLQVDYKRGRSRIVDGRQTVNVDRVRCGRTAHLQIVHLILDSRDRDPLVVGRRCTAGNQVAIGIEDGNVQVPVARQAGSAVVQRANLLEEDLDIQRPGLRRCELVPVLIAGKPEAREAARIDRWIDIQVRTTAQERRVGRLVVALETIVLEDNQTTIAVVTGLRLESSQRHHR